MIAELIGHYRVVSSLGSGGMGVVWKAIDTRLNRPVALKALRDTSAENTAAVLRLRAEALAAASLDHPYICKIYELLETGTATMVVMEFVEGETLGDILGRRIPALVDTLRYGSEIAEGLANAHARGIVHRDVKPSNVMVTPHNHIKLLDFGIARITAKSDTETQIANGLTLPGDAPGTPQYMAPEQALGRTIDGRTDLFSLGVVLFRCLTGQLPFEGHTRDEYVQQMLAGKMRSLDELAPEAPYQVREIVKACLQREPEKRPEHAAIVAETLRRAADALSTGSLPITIAPPARGLQRWGVQVAILAFAIVAGVFALLQWSIRPGEEVPRELRPAVTWQTAEYGARISPDGKWLSFISDRQPHPRVFVQAIDSGNAVAVDVQGTVISHGWSPDGRELACVVRQGDGQFLVIVPAFFGGSPRASVPIEAGAQQVNVARWVGDKVFLAFDRGQRGYAFVSVTIPGGAVQDISSAWTTKATFRSLGLSPDGTHVVLSGLLDGRRDLWTTRLDGAELNRLTDDDYVDRDPVWIGNDAVAFQSNRGGQLDLWRISVSTRRATQMTSSHLEETANDATVDGGLVAFEQLSNANNLWRLDLPSGVVRQLTGDALGDYWPSVSETGSRVVFQRTRPTPQEGFQFLDARVFVAPLATSALEAQPVADGFSPRLSADGAWVAYYQRLPDPRRFRLMVKNLVTGEERTITDHCDLPVVTAASVPVEWINQTMTWGNAGTLYFIVAGDSGNEIQQADVTTPATPSALAKAAEGARFTDIAVAPNGGAVAWIEQAKEQLVIHVLEKPVGSRPVVTIPREAGSYFLAGWTSPETLLVKRTTRRGTLYDIELREISTTGRSRSVALIENAAAPTVQLDPTRGRVLLTRDVEGVHNIFSVSLRDGMLHRVTANESAGVSFSGIQPLRDDAIVFAREERKRDIWISRRKSSN